MTDAFSRRDVFASAAMVPALGLLPAVAHAATGTGTRPTPSPAEVATLLSDPARRARVRARVLGSCGTETVRIFYRLHIYAYVPDGNLVPLFTMNHLSVGQWHPLANGEYQVRTTECGVYCRYDTDEPLDEWENPFTHEKRKVWQFLGGPFTITMGADGMVTKGAELSPTTLRMESIGPMLFVPMASGRSGPNPMSPAQWPTKSSGPTSYWDSHATYGAAVGDALNEDIASAPAFAQFQNMGSWHPWMGMGARPGRTYGKAYGTKLRSLDDIPIAARRGLEAKTPEIFDSASWTKPRMDVLEYLATQKPERP